MCPRVSEQIRQSAETDLAEGATAVSVWSGIKFLWSLLACTGTIGVESSSSVP